MTTEQQALGLGPSVFLPDPDYRRPPADVLEVIHRPAVDVLEVIHRPDEPAARLPQLVVAASCGVTLLGGVSALLLR